MSERGPRFSFSLKRDLGALKSLSQEAHIDNRFIYSYERLHSSQLSPSIMQPQSNLQLQFSPQPLWVVTGSSGLCRTFVNRNFKRAQECVSISVM